MASWRKKTYEELPALSVRGPELRRSLRIVTSGFVLCMFWMVAIQGAQGNYFCRMLGFEDRDFGWLSAIPYVATLGQLVAAILIERTGLRKFQFIDCLSLARAMWLLVAAIPLLVPVPSRGAVYSMMGVLLAADFLTALGTPAWMTWMGDLIPRRIRGRYLGNRALIAAAVRLPFPILVGVLLLTLNDPDAPMTAAAQPALLYGICGLFAVGAIFGTADILLFHRIREVLRPVSASEDRGPDTPREKVGLRALFVDPLRNHAFRRYVLFGVAITFAMIVALPYWWRNALENLGFSPLGTNVVFMVVSPIAGMVALRLWGRLIDRWGRRPVLMLTTFMTLFSGAFWLFLTRENSVSPALNGAVNWVVARAGAVVGRPDWTWVEPGTPLLGYLVASIGCGWGAIAWGGLSMTQTGIVLGFSDDKGASRYAASSAALIGLGGVAGGLVGGEVTAWLSHYRYDLNPVRIGSLLWNNWHAVILLSLLARAVSLGLLIHMPDPGAKRVRHIMRVAGANLYGFVTPRFLYSLRVFGQRRRRDRNRPRDGVGDDERPSR